VVLLGSLLGLRAVAGRHAGPPPSAAEVVVAGSGEAAAGGNGTSPSTESDAATPPDVQSVLDEIGAAAQSYGVDLFGASVTDLRTGGKWALNGDQQMSFMSSSKFPWVAIATSVAGVDAVTEDAEEVFAISDNDAAARLIGLAGGLDAIDDWWYPALGRTSTCHQQWFGDSSSGECTPASSPAFDAAGLEFRNYSTADDMTEFLTRLWRGDIPGLSAGERAKVLQWSLLSPQDLDLEGDGTLTGDLPPDVRGHVYHKVGWDFDDYLSASDVGIVDVPGTTYAISLAAFDGTSSASQQQFLSWASCRVYVAMSGNTGWTCDPAPGASG
jgi:hypothetical protein